MSKQKPSDTPVEASLPGPSSLIPALNPDLADALRLRGLPVTEELEAPRPDILETFGVRDMCSEDSELPGCEAESFPYVMLGKPKLAESQKEGTKEFFLVEAYHATRGPILLTGPAIYKDDNVAPLYEWLRDSVKPGQVFKFGAFGTQKGYTVIRAIPVA